MGRYLCLSLQSHQTHTPEWFHRHQMALKFPREYLLPETNECRTIRTLDDSDLGQFGPNSDLIYGRFGPWTIRTLVSSDLDHWLIRTIDRKCISIKNQLGYMSRLMTKPTKWHMRPAKTQISLGIRPVCLCICGPYVRLAFLSNMLSSWNKVIISSSSSSSSVYVLLSKHSRNYTCW